MATIVRKEVRKRGFFGWVFLILFILFNVWMLTALVRGGSSVANMQVASEAEAAGRTIGGAIGMGMILILWAIGDVILGVLVLVTRGSKTIVTETVA